MNDFNGVLHCTNCGTDFKPSQPLELQGSTNTWGYPCPVCKFQVTDRKPARVKRALAAADFENQLGQFLNEMRTRGVSPQELVRVLHDELEFAIELANPGRRIMLNIIDLGEQGATAGSMPARDLGETRNSRSLTQ